MMTGLVSVQGDVISRPSLLVQHEGTWAWYLPHNGRAGRVFEDGRLLYQRETARSESSLDMKQERL